MNAKTVLAGTGTPCFLSHEYYLVIQKVNQTPARKHGTGHLNYNNKSLTI
jgi:hypothetical protein